jgi:hypothetical protein
VFYDGIEISPQSLETKIVQGALKDGVLETLPEGLAYLGDSAEPLLVTDVVANEITGSSHQINGW